MDYKPYFFLFFYHIVCSVITAHNLSLLQLSATTETRLQSVYHTQILR